MTLSRLVAAVAVLSIANMTAAGSALAGSPTPTNEEGQIEVTLKDHQFTPSEIAVPAGKPVTILLKNDDASADEFDSTALRVEKVVAGHSTGIVRLTPLVPGRYSFMGEFHPNTAHGVVTAE